MVKKLSPRYRVILVIMLLAVALVATLVLLQNYNDSKEREMFMSLREDMKTLQIKFNKIHEGWKYNEGCRGKGGDYDRNIPSTCFLSISNKDIDLSTNGIQIIDGYRAILEQSRKFEDFSEINTDTLSSEFTMTYAGHESINCSYQQIRDVESSENGTLLTLGCIGYASEFYFPRNDL